MALTSSGKTQKRFPTLSWTPQPVAGWRLFGLLALMGLFLGGLGGPAMAKSPSPTQTIKFHLVRSAAAENGNCVADARGRVTVTSLGPVEVMVVDVTGLPPHTEFDFFVIQLPNAPFGLAWYQGDIETDDEDEGTQVFIGRFNFETFIAAQHLGEQQ